jgi:pilus assembly protein CpaB
VGLAVLALVLAVRPPPASDVPAPGRPTVPVAVAAADLPAGAVLTPGDLVVAALPPGGAPDGSAADPGELTGQVLAAPVRSGEVVTDVRVVGPGLWSSVPDGQVATPVRLADLAVATLLRPGDRVDVLAAAGENGSTAVEVVATGALVLTAPPGGAGGDIGRDVASDASGLLVLAVPPDTARRLAAAAAGGTLTVTLGRR